MLDTGASFYVLGMGLQLSASNVEANVARAGVVAYSNSFMALSDTQFRRNSGSAVLFMEVRKT